MRYFTSFASAAILAASMSVASAQNLPSQLPTPMPGAGVDQVSAALTGLGFSSVREAQLNGTVYRAVADYEDRSIYVLVHTDVGTIRDSTTNDLRMVTLRPNMSDNDMRAALEAIGYSNVRDLTKAGQIYIATGDLNGHRDEVRVDLGTGVVTKQHGGQTATMPRSNRVNPVTGQKPINGR